LVPLSLQDALGRFERADIPEKQKRGAKPRFRSFKWQAHC
jgi:hypothetical protein